MHSNDRLRTRGAILLVLAVLFGLFASYQVVFEVFPQTNVITGFVIIEGGLGNSVIIENSTQELIEELPENIIEIIPPIENMTENITEEENLTEVIENLTEPILIPPIENITLPENETLINKTKIKIAKARDQTKKSKKEMQGVLSSAIDYYCEEKSQFLTKCLIQTEKELCSIEGKEIVCNAVLDSQSYTDKLNSLEKKEQQKEKPKKKETFEPILTETPKEVPKETSRITGQIISQIKMMIKYKPELIVLLIVLLVLVYELVKTRRD